MSCFNFVFIYHVAFYFYCLIVIMCFRIFISYFYYVYYYVFLLYFHFVFLLCFHFVFFYVCLFYLHSFYSYLLSLKVQIQAQFNPIPTRLYGLYFSSTCMDITSPTCSGGCEGGWGGSRPPKILKFNFLY